jgi:seryl-tRNA synthetase
MIDPRLLRSDPELVRAGLIRRGELSSTIDELVTLEAQGRALEGERDDVRAKVNALSKQIGELHRDGRRDEAGELQAQSRSLGDAEKAIDERATTIGDALRRRLLELPNLPSPDAPEGSGEDDNVVVRVEGFDEGRYGDHHRVPHWESAVDLGILDLERAAKISGAMFVLYRGLGARLQRALVQFGLDRNADAFEEVRPPTMVRTDTLMSTGQLPKFADDAYHLERDDLWAIPTAEVPLTSLYRDEVLAETDLPVRLMAHTSCFRREAGSAGRDTRGLLRLHEFDKVEILAYATPDQAHEMHADLLRRAEGAIADLGLPYRILDLCAGDLGISSARTFDIEVYAPGADRWLEVSSVSWFSDYQARRANIRFRPTGAKGTQLVHTLNGSGLAVPRVWAALVETYRRPDGSIEIPEVLHPYMGGTTVIPGPV